VARDRQRRKDRQRARAAGGQPPPRKRERSRAREIGLDDPALDEAGLTDDAPAPDPLKNATPDVDQAKAAETGAERPGPDGEELDLDYADYERDRADDEVEIPRDLVRRTARGEGEVHPAPVDDKERGRVLTFLRACVDELRRVQWPDRKHVFSATAVVLGFVLIAGGWLGLMDAIWQPLINAIL
jgi:preprotein translocase SecE subunit